MSVTEDEDSCENKVPRRIFGWKRKKRTARWREKT
jgi:hypothetical protein